MHLNWQSNQELLSKVLSKNQADRTGKPGTRSSSFSSQSAYLTARTEIPGKEQSMGLGRRQVRGEVSVWRSSINVLQSASAQKQNYPREEDKVHSERNCVDRASKRGKEEAVRLRRR